MNPEDIRVAAEAAVSAFFGSLDVPDLSTGKFALIMEAIDADGSRNLYMATSDGQRAWDTLGLLMYGIQVEQTAQLDD